MKKITSVKVKYHDREVGTLAETKEGLVAILPKVIYKNIEKGLPAWTVPSFSFVSV
jgi:hypothetical protein